MEVNLVDTDFDNLKCLVFSTSFGSYELLRLYEIRNLFINLPTTLGEHTPKSKLGRPGCKLDTKLTNWKRVIMLKKPKKNIDTIIGKNLENEGRMWPESGRS